MAKESLTTGFYGSWHDIQKEKFTAIKSRIPRIAKRIGKGLALDIGCGNGLFEKEFSGNFIGVDTDEKMLRKTAVPFSRILADGNKLPFADYSFDSLVSVDTMHLIKGNDFLRVLKPGGLVLMAIFFNDNNYEERKKMLTDKLSGMNIAEEFTINSKEKEYVVVAEKPTF